MMMMTVKFEYSNEWYLNIFFKKEISNSNKEILNRPIRTKSNVYLEKIGTLGSSLVSNILEIEGVVSIEIQPYKMSISIQGEIFSWHELTPKIITVIKKVLECEDSEIVVQIPNFLDNAIQKSKIINCWWIFGHSWSKWYDLPGTPAGYINQRRDCVNCQKSQVRHFFVGSLKNE